MKMYYEVVDLNCTTIGPIPTRLKELVGKIAINIGGTGLYEFFLSLDSCFKRVEMLEYGRMPYQIKCAIHYHILMSYSMVA